METERRAAECQDYILELRPDLDFREGRDSRGHFLSCDFIKRDDMGLGAITAVLRFGEGRLDMEFTGHNRRRLFQLWVASAGPDGLPDFARSFVKLSKAIGEPLRPNRRPDRVSELRTRYDLASALASARYIRPELDWEFMKTTRPSAVISLKHGALIITREGDGYQAFVKSSAHGSVHELAQLQALDRHKVGQWIVELTNDLDLMVGIGEPDIDPYGRVLMSLAALRLDQVKVRLRSSLPEGVRYSTEHADFHWRAEVGGAEVVGPGIEVPAAEAAAWLAETFGRGQTPEREQVDLIETGR